MTTVIGAVVSDFDRSLANIVGGYGGMFEIMSRHLDISTDEAKKIYEETKNHGGFSIQNLEGLLRKKGYRIDYEAFTSELRAWFSRVLAPYNDFGGPLVLADSLGVPFVIVTCGNEDFQREKVQAVGLSKHELHIFPRQEDRVAVIRRLVEKHGHVLYVDDRPYPLDMLRDNGLGADVVTTVHIVRHDGSGYENEQARYKHEVIQSLLELKKFIPKKGKGRKAA